MNTVIGVTLGEVLPSPLIAARAAAWIHPDELADESDMFFNL